MESNIENYTEIMCQDLFKLAYDYEGNSPLLLMY
jgi:hypothetical protein